MRKLLSLFLLFVATTTLSYAQIPDWQWVNRAGGNYEDMGTSMAIDSFGNIYLAGYFKSTTIIFGSDTLYNSFPNNADIFLVKFDSNRNVIWAKNAGGNYDDVPKSIIVDPNGNTYMVGFFRSPTITFDTTILINSTTSNYQEIFFTKYDPNGNLLWSKKMGGTAADVANEVSFDTSGNIIIVGYFNSSPMIFDSITLTGFGAFVAKYDPNGNVIWADKTYGTAGTDIVNSVSADISGNIYVAGQYFSSTLTFGSFTLPGSSSYNTFFAKLDNNGNVIWLKGASGPGDDVANSIATDFLGNFYLTGYHSGNITFDTIPIPYDGGKDFYIAKYNSNGNIQWLNHVGNYFDEISTTIVVTTSGDIYVSGYFSSPSLIFDNYTLQNQNSQYVNDDIFLVKYDQNGNVLWASDIGGQSNDTPYRVHVDNSGEIYLTGGFSSPSINIGLNVIQNVDTTGNTHDVFLAKTGISVISNCTTHYTLVADTVTPHHYYIINNATGLAPISYLWSWGDGTYDSIAYPSHTYSSPGWYTICLTTVDAIGCSNTYCINSALQKTTNTIVSVDVIPDITTGINNSEILPNPKIYPNPASNILYINGLSNTATAEIYDISGKLLLNKPLNENQLEISSLAKGLYFIKLNTVEGSVVRKFVKE